MPPSLIELPHELHAAVESLGLPEAAQLRRAVRKLRDAYRAGRSTLVENEVDAVAYVVYRMPATYAAISAALFHTKQCLPGWEPRTLLDVGAGPGTAAWAALRVFPSIHHVRMLERDGCMRTVGVQLARAHRVLRRADWTDVMSGEFDLVTASYSLGEMPRASAPATWDATRGAVVVVEPGTPAGYRSVMEVRRHALGRGARVAAPCPHDDECPLALPHWCHFSQRLARTPLHRSLKNADLPWEDEKFSYVALARFAPKSATGRVVGRPRYGKHMVRLPICTTQDVGTRVIPASDEAYARARRASWGDGFA